MQDSDNEVRVPEGLTVARRFGLAPAEVRQAIEAAVGRVFPGAQIERQEVPLGRYGEIRVRLASPNIGREQLLERTVELGGAFREEAVAIGRQEKEPFDWRGFRVDEMALKVSVPAEYAQLSVQAQMSVMQHALLRAMPAYAHNGIRDNFDVICTDNTSRQVDMKLLSPLRLGLALDDFRSGRAIRSEFGLELGSDSRLSKEVVRELALSKGLTVEQREALRDIELDLPSREIRSLTRSELRLLVAEALTRAYPERGMAPPQQFSCDYDKATESLHLVMAVSRDRVAEYRADAQSRLELSIPSTARLLSDVYEWSRQGREWLSASTRPVRVELNASASVLRGGADVEQETRKTLEDLFPRWRERGALDGFTCRVEGGRLIVSLELAAGLVPPLYGRLVERDQVARQNPVEREVSKLMERLEAPIPGRQGGPERE